MPDINERLKAVLDSTTTPISTRISPSLHPDSVLAHGPVLVDGQGGPGEVGFAAGRSGLKALHETLTRIEGAHAAVARPMKFSGGVRLAVPKEREAELASAMGNAASRLSQHLERSVGEVDRTIAQLDSTVARATTNSRKDTVSESQNAAEVRSYVANLPDSKRMSFLQQACEDGDVRTVTAVLDGSHWVAGLNKEQAAIIRQFANEKFAPRESKQAAALRAVRKQLDGAAQKFGVKYASLLPSPKADPANDALALLKKA